MRDHAGPRQARASQPPIASSPARERSELPDKNAKYEREQNGQKAKDLSVAARLLHDQQEWPDKVELLLDGKTPDVKEAEGRGYIVDHREEVRDVLQKQSRDPYLRERRKQGSLEGCTGDDKENTEVIERKDAKGTTRRSFATSEADQMSPRGYQ
jgi:hypothetical protein